MSFFRDRSLQLFLLGSVSVTDSPARHLCFAVCGNLDGELIDVGYPDSFRGWYDFSGCGTCNDYCRWVGNTESGGDPSVRQTYGSSFWSCANRDDSYPTHGWDTQLSKCSERGAPTPLGERQAPPGQDGDARFGSRAYPATDSATDPDAR